MPSGRFITLRAKPFKESDIIIEALGSLGERVTLTAKNAIKSRRRFGGGVLEPLKFTEFYYTQSKSGYLYIQEAKLIYPFDQLRTDYNKLECGFYFLKLITKAAQEGMPDNKQMFDLLGNALKALEVSGNHHQLKLQFELKYLFYLGFLAPDDDLNEFVALPISQNTQIQLTEEEFLYLAQRAKKALKEVELHINESTL